MNKFKSLENKIRDIAAGKIAESSYKSFRTAYMSIYEQGHEIENDVNDQVVAGTYRTRNFDICPGAQKLYSNLPKEVEPGDAEKAAILQDQLFALEKNVVTTNRSTQAQVDEAEQLAKKIMFQADKMNLTKEHSYIQKHIDVIKKHLVKDESNEVTGDDTGKDRFMHKPYDQTKEKQDSDIDNSKFKISRFVKAQRKLKIIDND